MKLLGRVVMECLQERTKNWTVGDQLGKRKHWTWKLFYIGRKWECNRGKQWRRLRRKKVWQGKKMLKMPNDENDW